jgi:hypothetical protein
MADIWRDPDFASLEQGPQRAYLFILSQPDLSHAGLIPLRVRRWANNAAGLTPNQLDEQLDVLAESRFLVVDRDTEEVLVRTMVRNDGVYKQPKVMLRLREDAKQIVSPTLRAAFLAELSRLPLHELPHHTRPAVMRVVDTLRADFGDPTPYPTEGVSDTQPEGYPEPDPTPTAYPSEGVPDTPHVRAGALPLPPTPIPHSATPVADATAQTLLAEWIDHCKQRPPERVIGQVAKELRIMFEQGISDYDLRQGLAAWHLKRLHPSALASVVHEAREGPAARIPTTTVKVRAGQDMVAKWAEIDGVQNPLHNVTELTR